MRVLHTCVVLLLLAFALYVYMAAYYEFCCCMLLVGATLRTMKEKEAREKEEMRKEGELWFRIPISLVIQF